MSMVGVVVPLATATRFVVPDTLVTVPAVGVVHDGALAPLLVSTCPDVPATVIAMANAVEYTTPPAVGVKLALVPPYPNPMLVVLVHAPDVTVPSVVIDA